MCRIIAVANQKDGVGKTTACVSLGIGLAREGKRVLLVEADAQGSMAVSLGIQEPDELDVTLVNILEKIINDEDVEPGEGIIRHGEGIDFIPANIEFPESQFLNDENHTSRMMKNNIQELPKSQSNKTDINKTDFSDIAGTKKEGTGTGKKGKA